ncbi:EAL domain-containing protein [Shewanella woodyi]|uniref:EAL domain-containing protein n=1 Tax=Shewanella woodyi TaxID=60961 RepID=UPI0000E7772D|nr:EAL domain-containing protein [Shewanella woodyi]
MEPDVIFTLVQNTALLLAMVFIYDAVPRKQRDEYLFLWQLSVGAIIGGITMTSVMASWEYSQGQYFDARSVILGISGVFFGGLPTLIAVFLASIFSFYEGGVGVWFEIGMMVSAGLLGCLWRYYCHRAVVDISNIQFYSFGMILQCITLLWLFILPFEMAVNTLNSVAFPTLIIYPVAFLLLSSLLARRLEMERDANIQLQDDLIFRSQFNIGNIGIAISSVDQHWIKVNPRVCQMLKYSEKELLAMKWSDMTYFEDLQTGLNQFDRMLKGEIDEYEMDMRFVAKDNSIVYTHLTVACQRKNNKVLLVISGLLDITSQKLAESAMCASQEQLALVLDSSELGLWDWDIKSNKVERNTRCASLLGCSVEELNRDERVWINAIHRSDRVDVLHSIDAHLKGETSHHSIEYRLNTFSGETIWIQDSGKVVSKDEQGSPVRMCGTHMDITARKRGEESLNLAASVYNNSSEAMSVQDKEGNIITINSAFTEITGYREDEIINQHISILQCDSSSKKTFVQMRSTIEETGRWNGEIWLKHKRGSEHIVRLTINTILDNRGEVYRRVALFSDITEKKQAEHIIWKQANYDPLTSLPNRRMLLEYLGTELLKSDRSKQHFALMFLDLDFFKEVNDALGHDIGDLLLVETAKRLKGCIRESDVVARLGGDEFTVVLSSIADHKGVERVAEKILARLSEPFSLGSETAYISASIGITLYPDDAQTIDSLLKHADQAMYAAKGLGRNRYHYFTPSMQEYAKYRMLLIGDLRKAITKQEFEVYFQPIVDMNTMKVLKAEALIRWHHPERGIIPPSEFIPVAEETGLIVDIGNWVFEEAAKQSAYWREQYGVEIQISINKSPVQFRDERGCFESWIKRLKELKLDSHGICIEITEGLLLDVDSGVSEKLLAYRDAGIQVSLDDFGTGYSSLSYLKKFDIDYLKIDQSFTQNLASDSDDQTLCEAIIVMAHKLGMKVIAEGVETQFQLATLVEAGCDYGQGYLFSKPIPAKAFEEKYIVGLSELAKVSS